MKIKLLSVCVCIVFLLASCASKEEPAAEPVTPVVEVTENTVSPTEKEPEIVAETETVDETETVEEPEVVEELEVVEEPETVGDSGIEDETVIEPEIEEVSEITEETENSDDTVVSEESDGLEESELTEDAEADEEPMETEESVEAGDVEEIEEIEEVEEVEETDDDFYEEYDDILEDEPELIFLDEYEEETTIPEPDNRLSASEGEMLVISFETSGWVYLGDLLEDGVIQLEKRQNGLYSTTFTFSSTGSGISLLEFWVIDPLTDEDVYVRYEVTVTEVKESEPEVMIPEPAITDDIPSNPEEPEDSVGEGTDAVEALGVPETEVGSGEVVRTFLPLEEVNFKLFSSDELTAFFSDPENVAWYGEEAMLYYEAKVRETHPSSKDIKRSVACYELLVEKYPASRWWSEAQERAKYLRKYYYLHN